MERVLIVGLDGATFDVIQPLVERGRLPNLGRMMREGAWGALRSTVPPISPTAWTTFATGVEPGKHGVYDFVRFKPGTCRSRPTSTVILRCGGFSAMPTDASSCWTYPSHIPRSRSRAS